MYYVTVYKGPFAFVKPWTAVRDNSTFSQQFLTPSIIEGIEKKLFPELLNKQGISCIKRHKLSYTSISSQQEVTQTRGIDTDKKGRIKGPRKRSIITRGVCVDPVLYLAFENESEALQASAQHICLCRNEDLLFPEADVLTMTEDEFNQLVGFELRFNEAEDTFLVGYNRFANAEPMYGHLEITGKPVLGY